MKIHRFGLNRSTTRLSKQTLERVLGLKTFSQKEFELAFLNICQNVQPNRLIRTNDIEKLEFSKEDLKNGLLKISNQKGDVSDIASSELKSFVDANDSKEIWNFEYFKSRISTEGEKLDPRIFPMAVSFLLTGTSVGIVIPCMPLIIQALDIPSSQYGVIVASFALSKLFGNIPIGYLVDRYGRKPAIVTGLGLCAVGLGGISLALVPGFGVGWLVICRLLSGFGVSSFVGGANTYIADLSNPLNRTRSVAPVMASFQGGVALGPALGGYMIEYGGIPMTYTLVGVLFSGLTFLNQKILSETTPPAVHNSINSHGGESLSQGLRESFSKASSSWKHLLTIPNVRSSAILQSTYWMALAGSQMTLLPLHLVSEPLSLTASDIGASFAFMSVVSVISSQPVAWLSDKLGKIPMLLVSGSLVSLGMTLLAQSQSLSEVWMALTPLGLGSTIMSSVSVAHMSDLTNDTQRSQALSLLRTSGDLGFLAGAIFSGGISQWITLTTTMEVNASIALAGMTYFGFKTWNQWKIPKFKSS